MKRSFAFFALVCAILFGCVATAGAQSKALKKDVKKRVKELKKEGWKPLASSSTLEYAFSKYRTYLEEDSENRIELVGIAIGKNVKIGRENAIMNGITSYASRAKAFPQISKPKYSNGSTNWTSLRKGQASDWRSAKLSSSTSEDISP